MHFSILTVGIAAVLMAVAPAFSLPGLKERRALTEDDFKNNLDFEEFMLPQVDIGAVAANEFTPPEGLIITTITTLPDMTEGLGGMLMTMVTAVGVTSTEPVVPMLPTATKDLEAEHSHAQSIEKEDDGVENFDNMENGPVSLPVFTYDTLTGMSTVAQPTQHTPGNATTPMMSAPTNSLVNNGTVVSPSDITNTVTLVTSAIPTATNGTISAPTPPALSNSANGVDSVLISAGAFIALGLAVLAL